MKRFLVAATAALAASTVLTACGGGADPLAGGPPAPGAPAADTIRVVSEQFPENRLVAEIYAQVLEARGVKVERNLGIGSRETYFLALRDGSADLVPDYNGNLLRFLDTTATASAPDEVYAQIQQKLPPALTVLGQSGAQNKDAFVVTADTARRYNARSIADIAPHCGEIVFGGPTQFAQRPYGLRGLQQNYNCVFKQFRPLDTGGILTVNALREGTVQAADVFTADPAIAANGFVVLDDPRNNFPSQNVVPLITRAKATPRVVEALDAVSAKLTTEGLVALNARLADPDKPDVAVVAKGWLTDNGLV